MQTLKPFGYIYKIECLLPTVAGVYIGATVRTIKQRFKQHCSKTGRGTAIGKAIAKYGSSNFSITQLAVAYSRQELDQLEQHYIQEYNSVENGFNLAIGGIGAKPSAKLRRKQQIQCYKNKPVIHYETGIEYISGAEAARATGFHNSDITECCRMNLAQIKGNHFYYPDTDLNEYKEFWNTCVRHRPVLCIETQEVFKGISEAATSTGISRDQISGMCYGKVENSRAALHFKFAAI